MRLLLGGGEVLQAAGQVGAQGGVVAFVLAGFEGEAVALVVGDAVGDGVHGVVVALDFAVNGGDFGHGGIVFCLAVGVPFGGFVFVDEVLQQGCGGVALLAHGSDVLVHSGFFHKKCPLRGGLANWVSDGLCAPCAGDGGGGGAGKGGAVGRGFGSRAAVGGEIPAVAGFGFV